MVFGGGEGPRFASPHNDPLVVEIKVTKTIMRRIFVDTGSSVDIITWGNLKKLKYPGRKIVPLVHPNLGFRGQEVKPAGVIYLPLHFGDKAKASTLKVDFLVFDVPIAYNINLGQPTLQKVKVVITCTCSTFNLRLMMEVWVQCKETSIRPENAISSASGHW